VSYDELAVYFAQWVALGAPVGLLFVVVTFAYPRR
jgi:hypothetical protein